jgi:hypothetical protein
MQVDCTANPFCVNCKKEGHLSAMCSIFSKLQEPFWAGFGGDGKGFFCLEVAEEELQKPKANSALVCIEAGELTQNKSKQNLRILLKKSRTGKYTKFQRQTSPLSSPPKKV